MWLKWTKKPAKKPHVLPGPVCKKCVRRPGRTSGRESALPELQTAHYDAEPRSQPSAEEAPATSEPDAQT